MNIAIVGLGLIGGSLAKAIQSRTSFSVYGFDIDRAVAHAALAEGAIDESLTPDNLKDCELVIIALYPKDAVAYVTQHAHQIAPDAVVVDCCGVKRIVCAPLSVVAQDNGFVFVGGHPMAGTEKSGYQAARDDLFDGASMIVTPDERTPKWAMERIETAFIGMGFGRLQLSTPDEHDFLISFTSQLAHVISCAYIGSPSSSRFMGFSAGSFMDMTRVARLNETMWTELFLDNADYLLQEVEGMIERLGEFKKALGGRDRKALFDMLKHSREQKERVDQSRRQKEEEQ